MDASTPQIPVSSPAAPVQTGMSNDTRTIVTVLCLLFVFPIGLILMWFWTKWKLWVKLLISAIPLLFILIGIIAVVILAAINPKAQIQKANCVKQCQNSADQQTCISQCLTSASVSDQVAPKPLPSIPPSQNKLIIANINSESHNDPYEIIDVNLNNSLLTINVSYGGGCKQHDFRLYWDGVWAKSIPAIVNFYLIHDSNGDRCEALIRDELVFDVSELERVGGTTSITLHDYSTKKIFPKKIIYNGVISLKKIQTLCEDKNGKWLSQYNECEGIGQGINKNTCESSGGTYFQCESACRHDQQATICNYGCVQVCKF